MFSKAFGLAIRLAGAALLIIVIAVMAIVGAGFIEAFIAEPMRFFNG